MVFLSIHNFDGVAIIIMLLYKWLFIFVPVEKSSFANYVIQVAAAWIIICPLLLPWLSWMSPEDIYGGLLLFSLPF